MKIVLVLSLIVSLWSITPLVSSNPYLDGGTCTTVVVQGGDTVWGIAANYVTNKDDIRDLSHAIKQLNSLNTNMQILPGQTLKIPIKP